MAPIKRRKRPDRPWHQHWGVWMPLLLCFVGACSLVATPSTAPQNWNDSRGPTIPHDTFPTDCSLCHEGGGWHVIRADFKFDHLQKTGVALVGAHQHAECLRCHNDRGPVKVFASRGCAGCHLDPHRGQLGKRCNDCHQENNWLPHGQIAAHNRTRFPLTGAHVGVACFRCHPGAQVQNFSRAPVRCDVCHQQDLQRATNPNHIVNGWIQNCQQCHTPITWQDAMFNHLGVGNNCAQCHLPDYNATTNPNHLAAGFPTDCNSCHDTNRWQNATFNHTFRITSGPHRFSCSECHQSPSNYSVVSCTHCHAHTETLMNNKHAGRQGYTWSSPACINCHPTGAN